MKPTDMTKKYHKLYILFRTLSVIVIFAPMLYYVIRGFIEGETTEKLTLTGTFFIAIILTAVNVLFKYSIRSTLWIIVLGVYSCIENIMPLLLMIAIGTIIDEFILTPLYKSYRNKYTIHREIDKRG